MIHVQSAQGFDSRQMFHREQATPPSSFQNQYLNFPSNGGLEGLVRESVHSQGNSGQSFFARYLHLIPCDDSILHRRDRVLTIGDPESLD